MESRSSESRSCSYDTYSYSNSGESRSSESRISKAFNKISGVIDYSGYGSESSIAGESRSDYIGGYSTTSSINSSSTNKIKTTNNITNIENIDKLIEKLEGNLPHDIANNRKYNSAVEKRRKQIEELKKLRIEAQRKLDEEEALKSILKENEEVDQAINNIKKFIKK
jgi:hypothetical protein